MRKIGPAIAEDFYRYLIDIVDFTAPIINFVLPQFEGARKQKIDGFIDNLEALTYSPPAGEREAGIIVKERIDIEWIKSFADDYFRLEE